MTVDFEREFDLARPDILTQQMSIELCGPGGVGVDEEWIVVSQEMTSSKGHTQQTAFFKAVNVKVRWSLVGSPIISFIDQLLLFRCLQFSLHIWVYEKGDMV